MKKQKDIKSRNIRSKKIDSGITLIALVITIILLIILAGVTLSIVLGENGLLSKAKKGAEEYQYAGIKERIESEILSLDIDKIAKGEKLTVEETLIEMQKKGILEEIDLETKVGYCEGYVIQLGYNENEKVVILDIGQDAEIRIVTIINPTGYTNTNVKVSVKVKTNGQKVVNIEVPEEMKTTEDEGVYEIEKNGTYSIKAILDDNQTIEKELKIETIDKLPPKTFTPTYTLTGTGFIITAHGEDEEAKDGSVTSGIDYYEYYINNEKQESNEVVNFPFGTHNVYVVAYDKAGNSTKSNEIEVVFIKSEEGLLEKVGKITNSGIQTIEVNAQTNGGIENKVTYSLDVIMYEGNLVLDGERTVEGATLEDNVYEFGNIKDVATESVDAQHTVLLKVNGDLIINEGVTLTSVKSSDGYGGPKGMIIYCTGTLTNNGIISMTARGARANGENIYLWQNTENKWEYVPSVGDDGGIGGIGSGTTRANPGDTPITTSDRSTGSGGGGAGFYSGAVGGSGSPGTSYSGGTGGGGASYSMGENGYNNGAKGGDGTGYPISGYTLGSGGGAGNPGGYNYASAGYGENGTGGLLIIYASTFENNSTISSDGSVGGSGYRSGGGGSGGGSINIFYKTIEERGDITASGGAGGLGTKGSQCAVGGAGGEGSVTIGSIATGKFVKE